MQKKSVVYSIDRKTGKQTKVSEETGPMEKFEQEDITEKEFNDDTTAASSAGKAAAAAAIIAAKKKKQYQSKDRMKKTSERASITYPYKKKLGGPTSGFDI